MKNQYFQKDKKAEVFLKKERYQDATGVWRGGGFYPISASPLWCYARQNSQTVVFNAGVMGLNEESRLFVFNYNPKIKQNMYIRYKGAWFKTTRVDTQDDYNGDMFVYADDTPAGDTPRDTDIKPYDPTKV